MHAAGTPPTQDQLAQIAGVTRLTVRRALSGGPGVGAATRKRVLELARRHGYRPNAAARATRGGRTRTIELILGMHEAVSRIPTGLLEGIHAALTQRELHLSLSRLPDDKLTDERFLPRVLREVAADGLLINYTHGYPPKLLELIQRYRVPSVWLNAPVDEWCVRPDDELAGRLAARHLLDAGYRKLAMYFVGPPDHYSGPTRQRGFVAEVEAAGLTARVDTDHARRYADIRKDIRSDERLALAQAWLAKPDRPDAVLAYSVPEAGCLLLAAARLGLRVPEDLAIITVADEIMPYFGTPVTTVVLPWSEIARVAVGRLCDRIDRPEDASSAPIELQARLIQGATTRPAASA